MTKKIDLTKLKPREKKNVLTEEVNSPPSKAKLTDHIMVKFTPQEKRKISDLAERMGLKMSPYLRYILKKHEYI